MQPEQILEQIKGLYSQLAEAMGPEAAMEAVQGVCGGAEKPEAPEAEAESDMAPVEAGSKKVRQAL